MHSIRTRCLFLLCLLTWGTERAWAVFPESLTDHWDVSQGNVVTGGSPLEPFSLHTNAFGGNSNHLLSGHQERFNVIFDDVAVGQQLHWIEWQTPAPMTLRSFVLNAEHDGPPRDIFWRGFSRFTLFGYNETTSAFDIKIFEIFPADPFGDTPSLLTAHVETNGDNNLLSLAANISPITTNRFRAEFVQPGDPGTGYLAPRILELDGYDQFYPGIPTPEPATWALLGPSAVGLLLALRHRRRRPK